jgi:uncharacterized protein DUF2877
MASAAHSSVWPAAVSPLLAAELAAAPRCARVLAAFPTALYLLLDRHDRVLPVLADDALRLPTGLRLGLPSRALDWGVAAGSEVLVGDGRVRLPQRDVVALREWRPSRVSPCLRETSSADCADSAVAAASRVLASADVSGVLRGLAADVAGTALRGGSTLLQVAALVGAGPGLTPSGDDALCGVLLALRAVGGGAADAAAASVAGAVRAVAHATTSLSASLLGAAAQGYAVPEAVRLVRATVGGDARETSLALPAVLAIGHTSGADLVAGLAGTIDALARHGPAPLFPSTPHLHTEGASRA